MRRSLRARFVRKKLVTGSPQTLYICVYLLGTLALTNPGLPVQKDIAEAFADP
jgi:hypothetical protein